ncbi:glycosyltransferase family 4 protein [Aquirufa ecclesiirivi]
MSKEILIVNCVYDPEPVVSAQIGKSLAESLELLKYKVTVICPYPSRPIGFHFKEKFNFENKIFEIKKSDYLRILKLPSFVFPGGNLMGRVLEGISFGLHSFKYIVANRNKIDRVYMNTWPLFGQMGVALACNICQIKYIVHVQDLYPESLVNKLPKFFSLIFLKLLMPIEKYVIRNSLKIVAISPFMKNNILSRGGIDEKKIIIINNWQDESGFENAELEKLENIKRTFMYLGNIGPVSNIPFVIQAFYESKIDSNLLIAGSGSMRKDCEDLVKSLGSQNIRFLNVPNGEVHRTQSTADILILSTIKNGAKSSIPSKLPAYMFSKKPILALLDEDTDTYNAIIKANCGWVVNPDAKSQLIKMFRQLNQVDKLELLNLGLNGFNYALNNFSKTKNLSLLTSTIINDN